MSQRFKRGNDALYAWPPFMVAQYAVLGKDYEQLRVILENPTISETKAFEALIQLAVLVRLLSEEPHDLVPSNKEIQAGCAFDATEMFHVVKVTTLEGIIQAVKLEFSRFPEVVQVVAVPLSESFPLYDFFILHKLELVWTVAAGYQCKSSSEYPTKVAWAEVALSVWVDGKCRKYRLQDGSGRLPMKEEKGWKMLGESWQQEFLGVSISEALPQDPDDGEDAT
jgi:hypothetical protein